MKCECCSALSEAIRSSIWQSKANQTKPIQFNSIQFTAVRVIVIIGSPWLQWVPWVDKLTEDVFLERAERLRNWRLVCVRVSLSVAVVLLMAMGVAVGADAMAVGADIVWLCGGVVVVKTPRARTYARTHTRTHTRPDTGR